MNAYKEGHSAWLVLRTFVVLATISARFVTSHINTRGAPTKKTKKCRFCPFWQRFQPNGRGTAVFKMSCSFVDLSSSPDAELKTYVGIFENFAYELRNRGVSAGVLGKFSKNRHFKGAC